MPNDDSEYMPFCRSSVRVLLALLILLPQACLAQESGSQVTIVPQAGGYVLQRDGQPFFIKGAEGALHRLDSVIAAGGNSIRLWSEDDSTLELTRRQGLTVLLGLALGIPRRGFDYRDSSAVQK